MLTIAAVCSLLTMVLMKLLSILMRSIGRRVHLRKRRVAGSEVVERNADPDILQAADGRQHLLAVLQQRRLGDLDLQAIRREAGFGDELHDVLRQLRVAELDRRDVDRELEVRWPGLRFLKRLLDHADGQRSDEPRLFRSFDERLRLQEAAGRRAPAGKRLEADQFTRGEIDQRLEEGDELAILDAAADILLKLHAVGHLPLQLRIEPGEAVPSGPLGGVEREIALAKDVLLLLQASDIGEADRRGNESLHVADLDRLGKFRQDRLGERLGFLRRSAFEQNGELVAPDACAAASLRARAPQARRRPASAACRRRDGHEGRSRA